MGLSLTYSKTEADPPRNNDASEELDPEVHSPSCSNLAANHGSVQQVSNVSPPEQLGEQQALNDAAEPQCLRSLQRHQLSQLHGQKALSKASNRVRTKPRANQSLPATTTHPPRECFTTVASSRRRSLTRLAHAARAALLSTQSQEVCGCGGSKPQDQRVPTTLSKNQRWPTKHVKGSTKPQQTYLLQPCLQSLKHIAGCTCCLAALAAALALMTLAS